MKHAGKEAIARLEPLIMRLRDFDELNEKRSGVFYRKSRAFLHFHEDPKGLFVDVRLSEDFIRLPNNTANQQRTLIARIERVLSRK